MIVTKLTLEEAKEKLISADRIALDTETTGLKSYLGDRVFSLIIATKEEEFYFNFNTNPDHLGETLPDIFILPLESMVEIFYLLPTYERVYIHNAKFDLHMIVNTFGSYTKEILLDTNIYCTQALARLVRNDLLSYRLEDLAKFIGHEKDKSVDEYISKHKLFTTIDTGKKEPEKLKHYNLVPFELITTYGLKDARICFDLGEYIINRLDHYNFEQVENGFKDNRELIKNELALTKVLFKMENIGVKIDVNYCNEAFNFYVNELEEAKIEFKKLTGIDFVDSRKTLAPAFDKLGLKYPKTEKGNASFTDEVLASIDNPVANIIKKYRSAYKNAFTYYKNFLDLSDENFILHTNLKQGGTTTGRMSCSEPNLQNVPKRADKGSFKARKAFIPRKGYFFAMLDYDQMEYRLFMDYAGEMALIQKVLDGLDVHTATAEMVGVSRDVAKTINFLLLYGGGNGTLAGELGIPLSLATDYKNKYFLNLQNVKKTSRAIINSAESRGYIFNTIGRRCYIPSKLVYKAPNYLIQGGCGDIVKRAMIKIDDYLKDKESRMILQIHDEILLEVALDEYTILEDIRGFMVDSYNYNHLPLTAGVDFSLHNWHDKEGYTDESYRSFQTTK